MQMKRCKRLGAALLALVLLCSVPAWGAASGEEEVQITFSSRAREDSWRVTSGDKLADVVLFHADETAGTYYMDFDIHEYIFVFPPTVTDLSRFDTFNHDYVVFYGGTVRFITPEGSPAALALAERGLVTEIVPAPAVSVVETGEDTVRLLISHEPLCAAVPVSYRLTLAQDGREITSFSYELTDRDALYSNEFTMDGLTPGTEYTLRVEKRIDYPFGTYEAEPVVRSIYTARSAEQKAAVGAMDIRLEEQILADKWLVRAEGSYVNWEGVSNLSQFTDPQGHFCYAYADGETITVVRTNNGAEVGRLTLPQTQGTCGGVYCAGDGNYWVVEACTGSEPGDQTIWISKYAPDGSLLGRVSDAGTGSADQSDYRGAREPFGTGNCSIAEQNGILLVNFGKRMYNGHQASANVGVRMDSMEKVYFDFYNSHSFANDVIPYGATGGFALLSQGDCYPRAFRFGVTDGRKTLNTLETFHFWVEDGAYERYDMYQLNRTYSRVGGMAEMSTGLLFAGTSARSMSSSVPEESQDVFIQIFDPQESDPETAMRTSGTRSGLSGNNGRTETTDYGVQWITALAPGQDTASPKLVKLEDDLALVIYELNGKEENGARPHGLGYAVVDAWGEVLKQGVLDTAARLIGDEPLVYADGSVWWVMTDSIQGNTIRYKLTLSPGNGEEEWHNPFTDVSRTDSFYPAVRFVYERGLFAGVAEDRFAPGMSLTRGMFVSVLGRLEGVDQAAYPGAAFPDTPAGQWYTPYVAWAAEKGIVVGFEDGTFRPGQELTVEQAVTIMYNYAQYAGLDVSASADALSGYRDGAAVSSWAVGKMRWAVENGLYTGADGMLSPREPEARSQAAELLYNYVSKY